MMKIHDINGDKKQYLSYKLGIHKSIYEFIEQNSIGNKLIPYPNS